MFRSRNRLAAEPAAAVAVVDRQHPRCGRRGERHCAARAEAEVQLHAHLLLYRRRDVGVVGSPDGDGGSEGADEDRSHERRPDRRAEVLRRVLQSSDFAAILVVDARLQNVAELGRQQAHTDAEEGHGAGEGQVVDLWLDRSDQPEGGAEHRSVGGVNIGSGAALEQ